MKKICMLLALTAFVFTSCSNNEDTAINQAENSSLLSRIKVVHIKNGQIVPASRVGNDSTDTALSFKTLKDFTDFKALLKYKSTEEKQMIVKSLGFNNMYSIYEEADAELDSIGEIAQSEEEFKTLYANYKKEYEDILVGNGYDQTDLSLYIPASEDENTDAFIAGKEKLVSINDKVIKMDFQKVMNSADMTIYGTSVPNNPSSGSTAATSSSSSTSSTTSESDWATNSFIKKNGHKKTIFACSFTKEHAVRFHFGAQKKMWYGWKRDNNRDFYYRLEYLEGVDEKGRSAEIKPTYTDNTYHFFLRWKTGNLNVSIGDAIEASGPVITRYQVTGDVYVWTDMMVDKDSNGNIIHGKFDKIPMAGQESIYPQLSKDKAYKCRIRLKE